jgi:hypothetical protein
MSLPVAKRKLLTVKVDRDVLADFQTVARLRGFTMSSLVMQFILRSIREQKVVSPEAFPDYSPEPKPTGESEFDQILYEAFGDRPLSEKEKSRIAAFIKAAMEIQEITEDGTEIK